MRIAVLEDSPADAALISACLTQAEHDVYLFEDGRRLVSELAHESFDMLLLDWVIPGMDGNEVLKWVRAQPHTERLPVLFLTSQSDELNLVVALTNGADDYLIKPFRTAELLARIEACTRRMYAANANKEQITYGAWQLHRVQRKISYQEIDIELTQKEFDLVYFLFANSGRLLSRGHLLERVWGLVSDIPTRTLDTHISRIRTKCLLFPENGVRLSSVYGYGYRLELLNREI
jgi:DNA-binding response OmpR family regulator